MPKPLTKEKWKVLWFTNAKYQVSNFGKVKSIYTIGSAGKLRLTGTILKTSVNQNGYEIVKMQWLDKGQPIRKTLKVHRIVCGAFHPNPENKPEVNHKDSNPLNNHFRNLEWCTTKENAHHAMLAGRRKVKIDINTKRGGLDCVKPVIHLPTGTFWTPEEVGVHLGMKRRYVHRMLTEERRPNKTQYRYA